MSFLNRLRGRHGSGDDLANSNSRMNSSAPASVATLDGDVEKEHHPPVKVFSLRVFAMAVLVSMGGLIFGYDTGQISGFLAMPNFLERFGNNRNTSGNPSFSNERSGTIVGLLSIGALVGATSAAPISDKFGRKYSIIFWCMVYIIGVIVQITATTAWYQVAIGRLVGGLGVGGLSVLVPMYQAETAPRQVRGALVSCYQLFITLGILLAYCVNAGTQSITSSVSWRVTMGLGFIWPSIMAFGMLFLRESPRWDFRANKVDAARTTIAKSYGVPESHPEVVREVREIQEKLDAESAGGGKHPWYEIFTGPKMGYRTVLGMTLQALQQLTGANFFFYYGTTIFRATGIENSYITAIILGAVNFVTTFPGLYIVDRFGRRPALIIGGLWMFVCFMVFASIGSFALDQDTPQNTPGVGAAMIVFACLFIAGFATTWGPITWALVGEIYPSRYRAKCMALATATNWLFNFLISFFTPMVTNKIDYKYGYVFASCCFAGAVIVYFFVPESQGRSLEEIDTMYVLNVNPRKSKDWKPPVGEELTSLDDTFLTPGARGIRKGTEAAVPRSEQREDGPARQSLFGNGAAPSGTAPAAAGES